MRDLILSEDSRAALLSVAVIFIGGGLLSFGLWRISPVVERVMAWLCRSNGDGR